MARRWTHLFDFRNERHIVTTRLIADALQEIDSVFLQNCVERGIYAPASVLKQGGIRSEKPEPWLR